MKTAHKKYVCEFLRLALRTIVEERAWEQVLLSRARSGARSRARIISRESTAWMPFYFKIRPRSSTPLKLSSLFFVSQLFSKPNVSSTVFFAKCWRKKERGVSPSRVPFFFTLITFKHLLPWDLTKSTKLSVWACYLPEVFSLSNVVDQQIERHQRWDWCKTIDYMGNRNLIILVLLARSVFRAVFC